MAWNYKSIEKIYREKAVDAYKDFSKEDLINRIVSLESTLHPISVTLSSIDENPGGSIHVTSKLFPLLDEDDRFMVYDSETGKERIINSHFPPEALYKLDYYTVDSMHLTDGTKIPDDFTILDVSQSVSVASIFCGKITMEDVRKSWKVLNRVE